MQDERCVGGKAFHLKCGDGDQVFQPFERRHVWPPLDARNVQQGSCMAFGAVFDSTAVTSRRSRGRSLPLRVARLWALSYVFIALFSSAT